MKLNLKSIALSTIFTISICFIVKGQSARTEINFNRDWKFQLGDAGDAENPAFNDSKWETVGLPHSFSIPYFMSSDFYMGYGWYRKHFNISRAELNKNIAVEFEGAFQVAEVFINGKRIGIHKGGYTGFSMDISSALKIGDNVCAVRVNNLWDGGLAPRAGEHTFSGGIYRDVKLVIADPIHIVWNGTFIKTPIANKDSAVIELSAEIENKHKIQASIHVETDLLGPDGQFVARMSSASDIPAGKSRIINQRSNPIRRPQLWHPNHPFLYQAITKIYQGKKIIDTYTTNFGIRTIRWTADSGFFINGEHLYLMGANVHQDHAGWGDAVTDTGIYRDVAMIKEAGFNFIRGSHYPHDPEFATACDELGILFWCENSFWGIGGSTKNPDGYWNTSAFPTNDKNKAPFEASIKQELQEMIRINRNHPSIIAWSMSNEPFFTAPKTIGDMRKLLKELVKVSHEEDPTRAAAIGGTQRPLDSTRIDKLGDVAGYNGDGSTIPIFQNPGFPTVVTEYGSTPADRPGNYEPGWGNLSPDSGKNVYLWRSGQAIWCGFDHGSIAGAHLGKMGIVDYFRIPKRAWYWYRNHYRHIPPPAWPTSGVATALKLEADRKTSRTDGTEDVKLMITVVDANGRHLSNSPNVKLAIVSGPGEFPTGNAIEFSEKSDINIADGQASIEYRSWYAGRSVVRATSPGLKPAEVAVDFTGSVPFRPGVSPQVKDRPYVRFTRKNQPVIAQVFGKNNPTSASSAKNGHSSGYAADGNVNTWWEALPGDNKPSWTLDMEKRIEVSSINIHFPGPGVYRYKVEVGESFNNFKVVADLTGNPAIETTKNIKLSDVIGSYVRLSFDSPDNARLAEIEVTGIPAN